MAELAPGTMVTANVRLIKKIAEGGMGSVWLADHLGLESKVAVKFITPLIVEKDPGMRERFKREASICARIRSIHVVQVFDHGMMADGMPYIVMELLEGRSLTDRVEGVGPMSLREVGMLVAQVCKVLHRAHEIGIVHRDIKPDNIHLTDTDYELFTKVLDFGIAKQMDPGASGGVTKTGVVVGTPEFMSPEQAVSSKHIDHRSDLYSLGVVAYYALTAQLPYDLDADEPLWMQMASGKFTPPTEHVKGLPETFDRWFKKALQPKPDQRFQSAKVMARVLAELISADSDEAIVDELSSSLGPDSHKKVAQALEEIEDVISTPRVESLYPAKYDLFGPESGRSTAGRTMVMGDSDHRVAEVRGEAADAPLPMVVADTWPAPPGESDAGDGRDAAAAARAQGPSGPGLVDSAIIALPPARGHAGRGAPMTIPGTQLPMFGEPRPASPVAERRIYWAIVALCALVAIVAVATWALTASG